jgi:hypothetical protein
MSTFSTCTSTTRPPSPTDGDVLFETDTKNVIIWDGTNWRGYQNDGIATNYASGNTHSGEFDGNDYAVGSVAPLNSIDAYSTSFWFKYDAVNKIPLSGGSNASNRWYIHIINSTTIEYGSSPSGSYPGPTYPSWSVSSMSSSNWYHVALVHDNTSVTLYLKGVSQGTKTGASSANQTWRGTNINIGRYGASSSFYWDGFMDEVSVFDRALTSTEVGNIYSNKLYLNPTALWRLNGNTNDELGNYDLTNNTITFNSTTKAY